MCAVHQPNEHCAYTPVLSCVVHKRHKEHQNTVNNGASSRLSAHWCAFIGSVQVKLKCKGLGKLCVSHVMQILPVQLVIASYCENVANIPRMLAD